MAEEKAGGLWAHRQKIGGLIKGQNVMFAPHLVWSSGLHRERRKKGGKRLGTQEKQLTRAPQQKPAGGKAQANLGGAEFSAWKDRGGGGCQ